MRSDDEQVNEIEALRSRVAELEAINRGLGLEAVEARSRADAAESMRKAVEGMALDLQSEATALRERIQRLEAQIHSLTQRARQRLEAMYGCQELSDESFENAMERLRAVR